MPYIHFAVTSSASARHRRRCPFFWARAMMVVVSSVGTIAAAGNDTALSGNGMARRQRLSLVQSPKELPPLAGPLFGW